MLKAVRSGAGNVEVKVEQVQGAGEVVEMTNAPAVVEQEQNAVVPSEGNAGGFSTLTIRNFSQASGEAEMDEVDRMNAEMGVYTGESNWRYLKAEGREFVDNKGNELGKELYGVIQRAMFFFQYYDQELGVSVRIKDKSAAKKSRAAFEAELRKYNPHITDFSKYQNPDDFKYRVEIHFVVPEGVDEETGEEKQTDYILNGSFMTAATFRDHYVRALAALPKDGEFPKATVQQVLTKLTISMQDTPFGKQARYEFTAYDLEKTDAKGNPISYAGVTTVGKATPTYGKRKAS